MTLAHELGHGVHQVLAGPNGALMAPTPLTLAETASAFGEMLTFRALLLRTTNSARRRAMPELKKGCVLLGTGRYDPKTTMLDADGQGTPYETYAFAAQLAVVEVDTELGTVKVRRIVAAHDVGRAINPTLV